MEDDEGRRGTYGIWGVVAVFVALTVAGVAALILVGNPTGSTTKVSTPQTLPDGGPVEIDAEPAPVTMPDGQPAPDGVREVFVDGDTSAYSLEVPSSLDPDESTAVVAPAQVRASDDGDTLRVTIGCAESVDEAVAQVGVTEAELTVTVLAVVLVGEGGRPCESGSEPTVLDVPLAAPLDDRAVVVVPSGTPVPGLTTG